MKLSVVLVSFALAFGVSVALAQTPDPPAPTLSLKLPRPKPGADLLHLDAPVPFTSSKTYTVRVKVPLPVVAEPRAVLPVFGGIGVVLRDHAPDEQNGIGLVIEQVMPGGPAAKAGLQPGHIITEVDGSALTDPGQSSTLLRGPIGSFVRVEIMDQKDFGNPAVRHLMREKLELPKGVPGARNARWDFLGNFVVQPIARREIVRNPTEREEPAAQFSPADAGAADAIRRALTKAEVSFSITDGDPATVRVPPSQTIEAKEVLRKLHAEGHWSVMTLTSKDGKTEFDPQ